MSKTFYFDCSSGISGDMTVAALLDLGADREALEKMIASLHTQGIEGFQVKISRVKKAGIDVCDFSVLLDETHENHDHDMAWLHGNKQAETHKHHSVHDEAASHKYHDHHMHRSLSDILHIINKSEMSENARTLATRMFTILAEAEAKAHGVTPEEVHFHEVGAVDSIVDILAVAVCADSLGMDSAVIPWLHEGEGMIRCQHGMIPVPVPAVTAIAEKYGLVLRPAGIQGELVTPTGAAIAACFGTQKRLPDMYRILCTGIGAGKREYGLPGILRIMMLETDGTRVEGTSILIKDNSEQKTEDTLMLSMEKTGATVEAVSKLDMEENGKCSMDEEILKLETDIDDCSGEALGYCMEQLFAAGARDVHYIPIYMKKNRPGYQLQVICTRQQAPELENIIFRETTTIGIRRIPVERTVMNRTITKSSTPWGEVRIKICENNGLKKAYPEYEDVARICREQGLPFFETFSYISEECKKV